MCCCVYVLCVCCVCDGLGIGCGRTCETCMQSDSCCPYAAAGWQPGRLADRLTKRGRRQTSLTNVSYAYKAHLSHLHTHLHSSPIWFYFFTTLCYAPAAGWAIKTVARSVSMSAGCSYYRLFKPSTVSESPALPPFAQPFHWGHHLKFTEITFSINLSLALFDHDLLPRWAALFVARFQTA